MPLVSVQNVSIDVLAIKKKKMIIKRNNAKFYIEHTTAFAFEVLVES